MKKNNFFGKVGLLLALTVGIGFTYAQKTTGDINQNTVGGKNEPGKVNGTVRVVDNKGTIKYLQAANGITTLTNTTNDVTTTTWQLGGSLTDDTYIDVNGKVFALDKLSLETGAASTDATDASSHGTGTGWTVLVRDEATGAIKKIKATDLLQVQAGHTTLVGVTGIQAGTAKTITGIPNNVDKVSVYRNGAKLVAGTDYTVAADSVTLIENTTAPNDWTLLTGDVIEIHWVK